jgi:hypothetical protein
MQSKKRKIAGLYMRLKNKSERLEGSCTFKDAIPHSNFSLVTVYLLPFVTARA